MDIDGDSEGISIDMTLEEAGELGLTLFTMRDKRAGTVGSRILDYLYGKGFSFPRTGKDGARVAKVPSEWPEEAQEV